MFACIAGMVHRELLDGRFRRRAWLSRRRRADACVDAAVAAARARDVARISAAMFTICYIEGWWSP